MGFVRVWMLLRDSGGNDWLRVEDLIELGVGVVANHPLFHFLVKLPQVFSVDFYFPFSLCFVMLLQDSQ
jgi:hypothetical protein